MPVEPYRTRRGLLMEQLKNGLILVRGAGTGGARVNPSFAYLTGLAEPSAVLLLAPGGVRVGTGRANPGPDQVRGRIVQQVLFLPGRDPVAARWGEDAAATVETLTADAAGVEYVYPLRELPAVLGQALLAASRLYVVRGHHPGLAPEDDDHTAFVDRIRRRFLHLDVRDATSAVHEMRRVKEADEVRAIERSIGVVAEALGHITGLIRPGMLECEIEAEIAKVYRAHGGVHAFEPIVAAGPNALLLHYNRNDARLEPGQLLLVDTGVSIDGYAADITRTYPVDGRFTDRQREVYDAVLAAERTAIEACRPGAFLGDLHAAAWSVLEEAGLAEHYIHGIGHHLGLETHDVGDVHRPLVAGAVVTIEPGAYVEGEGIGVRIEDDVLVTGDGCRVLSEAIPKTAKSIEERMAR